MKTYLVIVVIGITQFVQINTQQAPSPLEKLIYSRCQKYSTQSIAYDNLKVKLDDFLSYFKYTSNLIPNGKQQFCHDEKPKLATSIKGLTNEMGSCFPKEEQYLPSFIYRSFKGFLGFMCDDNGKNIDNLFSSQSNDCRKLLGEANAKEQIMGCFSKIFAPFNGIVTKDNLCDDLHTARKCFTIAIDQHCPNFNAFNILVKDFFSYIEIPCRSASASTRPGPTFTILTVFLFIFIKFY